MVFHLFFFILLISLLLYHQEYGVSYQSLEALKASAASEWVEVLLSRINHKGAKMDELPEKVMPLLKQAHDRGAVVIGMKIYGCGDILEEKVGTPY